MREMKDSGIEWIGEIPQSKRIIRNKYLLEYTKGKLPTDTNFGGEGFPYIGAADLDSNESCKTYTRDESLPDSCDSDLLVLWDGARAGLCGTHKIGKVSSTIVRIREVDSTIYRPFLYWYYKGFQDYMYQRVNGTTIPHMNRKYIEEIQMIDWTVQEQRRIADYLDRKCSQIDTIIARQQELIEKLKAYKLSIITEAVTKGLNPDVPMKDSGVEWIGKIPEHWKIGKLCFFTVRIGDGLHGTPEFDDAGEYYFINGNNLGDTYITIRENTKSVSLDEYNKYFIALNENTLLISLNGTIGNVSQYHGEQIILGKSAGYIIVDSRRELTIDYLKFYLQSKSVKTLFELSFAGTTINNLSLETLRNLPVCIMTGEEQFHIAKFLEKKCARIDQVIQKKTLTIDKLNEYKKSLIYEVVTGKREV